MDPAAVVGAVGCEGRGVIIEVGDLGAGVVEELEAHGGDGGAGLAPELVLERLDGGLRSDAISSPRRNGGGRDEEIHTIPVARRGCLPRRWRDWSG